MTETERRDAWLAARRNHITSTDVAQILGLSKYGGPTSVYLDKTDPQPKTDEEWHTWGRRLEEAILTGYAEREGVVVNLADPYDLLVHPEHPLIACSLDALAVPTTPPMKPYPVDAKNIRYRDPAEWGDDGTDEIPDHYVVQLHVQMMCTGADHADLAVLFGGSQLAIFKVQRDDALVQHIIDASEAWWQRHVMAREAPPPDGTSAYDAYLAKRKQEKDDTLVLGADDDLHAWLDVLRDARRQAKTIEAIQTEAEQNVKERIGAHLGLARPGCKITWKQAKDTTTTDFEALAVELILASGMDADAVAALRAKHTKTKPGSRRFLVKFTDDEEQGSTPTSST